MNTENSCIKLIHKLHPGWKKGEPKQEVYVMKNGIDFTVDVFASADEKTKQNDHFCLEHNLRVKVDMAS